MNSIGASLLAIVVCGGTGGLLGWAAVRWFGLDGTVGAVVAALLGTLFATAAFIAIISLLRVFRRVKR